MNKKEETMIKYDISIVIPFLNEKDNLKKLIAELDDYLLTLNNLKAEVIFVDDGSTDGSSDILEGMKHISCSATIIKLSRNFGTHAALRAGVLHSSGKFVTFMFADLQDPLSLIDKLYSKCSEGYDIVLAYRKNIKANFMESFFSKLYARLMRMFVIKDFPNKGFDIVMFNQKVRDVLNQNIENNSSFLLQILTLGFKKSSVIYDKNIRFSGKSKWSLSKKIKMVIDSFVSFSYVPIRFVSIMGIVLSSLGFVWMSYIIVRTIIFRDLNPGWPSLIAILLLGFGITNISLGIIAEYLWRTLDASRNRKSFIIDKIYSINK